MDAEKVPGLVWAGFAVEYLGRGSSGHYELPDSEMARAACLLSMRWKESLRRGQQVQLRGVPKKVEKAMARLQLPAEGREEYLKGRLRAVLRQKLEIEARSEHLERCITFLGKLSQEFAQEQATLVGSEAEESDE